MKKPYLFNPVAAIAACMITSILNAALAPTPKWKREALAACWIGKHYGLDAYVIAAIQELLKLQDSVPLNIINNEVLSSYQPRICNDDAIEVDLQEAQTGSHISTTKFHTRSDSAFANPFDIEPEQKTIEAPCIPVIVNVYHITNNNDAAQRAQHKNKKLISRFSLSDEELRDIEAIVMNLNYMEIRYKNCNRIVVGMM